MPHHKNWPPVYPDKSPATRAIPGRFYKVSSDVLSADANAILSVSAHRGTISHIIDHAIKHTADTIRTYKLSYLDSERFIEWLCKRSFSEFAASQEGQAGHDGRGTQGSCESASDVADQPAGVGKGVAGQGGKGGSDGRGRGRGRGGRRDGSVRQENPRAGDHGGK